MPSRRRAVAFPAVAAQNDDRMLTLGELRELVEVTGGLPDDFIIRGTAIPFRMADLGNPRGTVMTGLAVDPHPDASTDSNTITVDQPPLPGA
jgi:hypothetical protein